MDCEVVLIEQQEYNAFSIAKKIQEYIDIEGCKKIFIKPNMVIDPWKEEEDSWIATVTNASLIEAVLMILDKKATKPVQVVIGDAPMARSNHEITLKKLHLKEIVQKYDKGNLAITLIDIRDWYWKYVSTMCVSRKRLPGDPKGIRYVNLFNDSAFAGKENKDYEAFDNINPVSEFHNDKDNIFSISASVLDADLFINLPKMKTHRIAGMTCALKNLVGINTNKNCVPHNTKGDSSEGGDAFEGRSHNLDKEFGGAGRKIRGLLRKKNPIINYCLVPLKLIYNKTHAEQEQIGYGMWYGNDTIWRSIIDLNRILLYCDKDGRMRNVQQRKYVCITDSIISGEGEGPLHPSPIRTNMILVSRNPVANDLVAAEIMGFDWKKIPSLYHALEMNIKYPLVRFERDEIKIHTKSGDLYLNELRKNYSFNFYPTGGWVGHIEKD